MIENKMNADIFILKDIDFFLLQWRIFGNMLFSVKVPVLKKWIFMWKYPFVKTSV